MSKLQLLCATMNQTDFTKIDEMRIQSDVVFANQGDHYAYDEMIFSGHRARMYTTATQGVGLNRNLALLMAEAKICLIADDDVVYSEGYADRVLEAFEELPDADVILFGLRSIHQREREEMVIQRMKRMGPFSRNPYGGPRIAFRLESIRKANIWFTMLFGGGSRYASGEDSYFILECRRKGLSVYTHPFVLGKTSMEKSSWFSGYGESLFYGLGAYFRMAHPATRWAWMTYNVLRIGGKSELSKRDAIRWMRNGSRGFEKGISFAEWVALYGKKKGLG